MSQRQRRSRHASFESYDGCGDGDSRGAITTSSLCEWSSRAWVKGVLTMPCERHVKGLERAWQCWLGVITSLTSRVLQRG